MALNIAKITLAGRLTADPEMKQTTTGKTCVTFSVAVNRTAEQTDFFDCISWNSAGEVILKNYRKGDAIFVIGNLQTRSYTNREGRNVKLFEINVTEHYFSGGNARPAEQPAPTPAPTYIAPQSPVQPPFIPTSGVTYVKNMSDDNAIPPEQEWDDALPF